MSEPVGAAPRGTSIPSNAHRVRDTPQEAKKAPVTPVAEKQPMEKIVQGTVVIRKPPWYKRMGRSMVADDASNIGSWVMDEIVVPGARQMAYTIIVGLASRTLFGAVKGPLGQNIMMGMNQQSTIRGGIPGMQSSLGVRYDQMSEPQRPMFTQNQRARHAFNEITLANQQEAGFVISSLIERIALYGAVTVADLYAALGQTGSYMDQGWGWTDLSTADIKQVPGGWLLDLPQPEPLNR